jgi:hypothetical protein
MGCRTECESWSPQANPGYSRVPQGTASATCRTERESPSLALSERFVSLCATYGTTSAPEHPAGPPERRRAPPSLLARVYSRRRPSPSSLASHPRVIPASSPRLHPRVIPASIPADGRRRRRRPCEPLTAAPGGVLRLGVSVGGGKEGTPVRRPVSRECRARSAYERMRASARALAYVDAHFCEGCVGRNGRPTRCMCACVGARARARAT